MSHGVSVKEYLELLETAGIEIEEKEVAKLEKMASDDGLVERHDFIHYAKKSSMFKTLVDAEKHHFDKAELAFKVLKVKRIITIIKLKDCIAHSGMKRRINF